MQPLNNRLLLVICTLAGLNSAATAQSVERGALLVATPALSDTTFAETVMVVLHHDDDGSIAIMINRPTNLSPGMAYPEFASVGEYDGILYFGGPASPSRAFVLTRLDDPVDVASIRIVGNIYLSADFSSLALLAPEARNDSTARIYAGHAQWGPNQLDAEIAAGAWELVGGSAADVFTDTPITLWQRVLVAGNRERSVRIVPQAD